jgi:hypothetical protein
MLNETVLADKTNGRKSYDFGQRSLFVFHVMQVKLEQFSDNLAPFVNTIPAIKMICYFAAEVQQENGRVFIQHRDKIA